MSNERRNKSPEAGRTARREPTSENPSEGVECERTDVSPTKTVEGRVELQSGGPPGSARADTTIPYFVADDGTRWIISTSRNLEPLEDGHVRLTGRTYEPSPCVAHIEGTHFELRDIERVDSKPDTQTDTD